MKFAIDAFGGDNAPSSVINGTVRSLRTDGVQERLREGETDPDGAYHEGRGGNPRREHG